MIQVPPMATSSVIRRSHGHPPSESHADPSHDDGLGPELSAAATGPGCVPAVPAPAASSRQHGQVKLQPGGPGQAPASRSRSP